MSTHTQLFSDSPIVRSAPARASIGNWPDPMNARIGNWPDPMNARIGWWPNTNRAGSAASR